MSVPILNLPILYANGPTVSYLTTTTLSATSGQVRDSTNTFDLVVSATPTTINGAINGLNGLDTGSLAASTFYYVYEIVNVQGLPFAAPGFLLSTSATAPLLPFGYSEFRMIAIWPTNSSSQFFKGYVFGNGGGRTFYYDTIQSGISAGTSQTLAAITNLANFVPPIDGTPVLLQVAFTPNTAGDTVGFASGGSTATTIPFVSGTVATKASTGNLEIPAKLVTGVPVINYINSAASGATTVYIQGFKYNL